MRGGRQPPSTPGVPTKNVGALNVLAGGQVVVTSTGGAGLATIGRDPGAIGTVTVSGVGSILEVPGLLAVAVVPPDTPGGNGVLHVRDQAIVSVTGGRVLRMGPGAIVKNGATIEADVDNRGGIYQLGCSPGLGVILGRYTGQAGSKLVFEVDANGAYDVLQVRDGITLEAGSEIVILIDPELRMTPGQIFPLVQSDTGASLTVVGTASGGVTVEATPEFNSVLPDIRPERVTTPPVGPLTVAIDIKPGSFPNSMNLGSAGTVPVAILSSEAFDATQVDPASVRLAAASVKLVGKGTRYTCSAQDVNNDRRLDLVCHVVTDQLQPQPGDSVAVIEARTFAGTAIRGQDSVRIVP